MKHRQTKSLTIKQIWKAYNVGDYQKAENVFNTALAAAHADGIEAARGAVAGISTEQIGSGGWILAQLTIDKLAGEESSSGNQHERKLMYAILERTELEKAAMCGVTADPPEGAVLELVEVVRAVEWVTRENGTKHHFCPRCGNWEHYGHASDCELDAALSRFRVEDGEGA